MLKPPPSIPWLTRTALMPRSRQIITVLTRHGLGWLLTRFEERVFHRSFDAPDGSPLNKTAEQLRLAFEELGPTFIKLGQAFSTRPDVFPPAYIHELNRLQDEVPPVPFAEIETVLLAELGRPIAEAYREFDPLPIASASIGQVYSARLHNGREVVVKVRRPGVEKMIEQDLEILSDMIAWLAAHSSIGKSYDLVSLLDEFAFRLRNELDYQREGHNADIMRQQFYDDPCAYIPRVYWDLTTARVITLERVRGIKITDRAALDAAGISLNTVAVNSARFTLRQLFEFGFFHADPHPGNFYVQADGTLAVMDFGMVGRITRQTKNELTRLVYAVTRGDTEGVVDVLLETGMTSTPLRRQALEADVGRFIESYSANALQYITTLQVFNQFMDLAFRYRLQLSSEFTMLARLMVINEGISQSLNPEFRMLDFATPYIKKFYLEDRSPEKMVPRLARSSLEGLELSLELPRLISRLLKQLERGQLELNVGMEGLREFTSQMQKMTNRLALSVLLAATIIALGMVMVVYHPVTWQRIGEIVFGLAFVSSLAFGIWLMVSIWRSGRT